MAEVTALILAGGQGTRLRGILPGIPKVLAPVGGRPFLSYLLDQLNVAGVREVVLCTGYRADQIFEIFGTRYGDLKLRYSAESRPLGTAGALRLALTQVEAERVLVLNGDSYIQCPVDEFHRWHLVASRRFLGHCCSRGPTETSRFGTVELGPEEAIRSFREKCSLREAGWINAGVYLFRRSLIESICVDKSTSLEREMFPRWVPQGLGGYTIRAPLVDIGTPESFAQAELLMAQAQASCQGPEVSLRYA